MSRKRQVGDNSRSRSRDKVRESQGQRPKRKLNVSGLLNIISEQKRYNRRLDNSELESANIKLKEKYPNETIEATLLTQHLSKEEELREAEGRNVDREKERDKIYHCTYTQKCKQKFNNSKDFMIHLNYHRAEEEEEREEAQKKEREEKEHKEMQKLEKGSSDQQREDPA